MFFYESLHMDVQELDDELEPIYDSVKTPGVV